MLDDKAVAWAVFGFINAKETAPNVSAVGNQIVTSDHNKNIAKNASLGPKASPTYLKTPPFWGYVEANSAATRDTGIKNIIAANI